MVPTRVNDSIFAGFSSDLGAPEPRGERFGLKIFRSWMILKAAKSRGLTEFVFSAKPLTTVSNPRKINRLKFIDPPELRANRSIAERAPAAARYYRAR